MLFKYFTIFIQILFFNLILLPYLKIKTKFLGLKNDGEIVFSIIIPVYKTNFTFLKIAIDSVFYQSYKNIELIIVDDSEDDIFFIQLENLVNSYNNNFLLLKNDSNIGISKTIQKGIRNSKGSYILILDHDDYLRLDCVEIFFKTIKKHQYPEVIFSNEFIKYKYLSYPKNKIPFNEIYLLNNNYITHPICFSTKFISEVGGVKEGFDGSQDYELILRMSRNTKNIIFINSFLYFWRWNKTSFSKEKISTCQESGKKAISEHLNEKHIPTKSIDLVNDKFIFQVNRKINSIKFITIFIFLEEKINLNLIESFLKLKREFNLTFILVDNNLNIDINYIKEKYIDINFFYFKNEINSKEKLSYTIRSDQSSVLFFIESNIDLSLNDVEDILQYFADKDIFSVSPNIKSRLWFKNFWNFIYLNSKFKFYSYFTNPRFSQEIKFNKGKNIAIRVIQDSIFKELESSNGFDEFLLSYQKKNLKNGYKNVYSSKPIFYI
jgi:glycosyltransferase involved in cell wall biosynthesis